MPRDTLNTALDYLDFNPDCYLFPITPLAKYPPCFDDNLKRASNDPDQIKKWHARFPGCNWGQANAKSNRIVVDLDRKEGKSGQHTFNLLALEYGFPPTRTVETPSGGLHLTYRCEPGQHVNALGKSGFGPDIDSTNYVLIPGCELKDGTKYREVPPTEYTNEKWNGEDAWSPEWFWKFLRKRKPEERVEGSNQSDAVVEVDQPHNIEWAIYFLKNDADEAIEGRGGELTTLKTAMELRDHGISRTQAKMLMADHYNVFPICDPLWTDTDLDKKIDNAYDYANINAPGASTAEAQFPPLTEDEIADIEATIARDSGVPVETVQAATGTDNKPNKPAPMSLQRLYKEWVWIVGQERFVRRRDGVIWTSKAFDSKYNYLQKPSVSRFIFSRRLGMEKLDKMIFRPGMGEVIGELYNTWRTSEVVPAQGDTTIWREHLEYLFPNAEDRDHVLNWMAWVYQNQAAKPNHALLLVGETHGTGKSFIARVFEQLIGVPNTKRPKNSSLKGDFNGWAAQCKLAVIEELMQIGRREVANELRDIITEPFIEVNMKNIAAFQIENYMAMFAISNHIDALPLEDSDRRWLVVRTDAAKRDFAYYARLFSILRDPDALAAVAYELQERKLGSYNGHESAPMNMAKSEMIEQTMGDVDTWMTENAGNAPLNRRLVTIQDVIDNMPKRLEKTQRLGNVIGSFLRRKLRGKRIGQHRLPDGARPILWAINGSAALVLQSADIGALYMKERDTTAKTAEATAAQDFE
jgi:hypothetical protein